MFIDWNEKDKLRQYDLAVPFDLRTGVTPGGISALSAEKQYEKYSIQSRWNTYFLLVMKIQE